MRSVNFISLVKLSIDFITSVIIIFGRKSDFDGGPRAHSKELRFRFRIMKREGRRITKRKTVAVRNLDGFRSSFRFWFRYAY